MSEVGEVHKVEGASTHSADLVIPSRRDMLNERLFKWSKFLVGGTAVGLAAAALYPVSVPLGVTVGVGGAAMEGVGYFGIVGNVLKRFKS